MRIERQSGDAMPIPFYRLQNAEQLTAFRAKEAWVRLRFCEEPRLQVEDHGSGFLHRPGKRESPVAMRRSRVIGRVARVCSTREAEL